MEHEMSTMAMSSLEAPRNDFSPEGRAANLALYNSISKYEGLH